jgi:hypothetical protein
MVPTNETTNQGVTMTQSALTALLSQYHGARVAPVRRPALTIALENAAADRALFAPSR